MNFEEIKEEIEDTLSSINDIQNKLKVDEFNHDKLKFEYDTEVLKVTYSDEYKKIKAIKEREQRAKLACADKKSELVQRKAEINNLKYDLDYYNLRLRYLFRLYDEGVLDDN